MEVDLFDYMREKNMKQESPLASRMRPKTLEEVVGQEHIIGKDKNVRDIAMMMSEKLGLPIVQNRMK